MAVDEFKRTRFCQEWRRPQGLIDFGTAALDKSATGAALFGVFRQERQGPFDDDTRWRMRQIVPHIRRAMLIARAVELKTAEASAFADTLDGVTAGMFLVSPGASSTPMPADMPCWTSVPCYARVAGGWRPTRRKRRWR
jgi:hypothetical protein